MSALSASRGPAAIYARVCAQCHDEAVEGAPRPGHPDDWQARLRTGIEPIVTRTLQGMPPHMPPRGLCNECTDDDIRAVVDFMLNEAAAPESPPNP